MFLTPSPSYFFFADTPTTEIYTLSLHDALPIFSTVKAELSRAATATLRFADEDFVLEQPIARSDFEEWAARGRSEEHTSELQSHSDLVCRLLLEKKKTTKTAQYKIETVLWGRDR